MGTGNSERTGGGQSPLVVVGLLCGQVTAAQVLLLGDGGSEAQVQSALEAAGHNVTLAGPYDTWDGSGLGNVDAVIYLDGANFGLGLMPAADAALWAFVHVGGRLVMTEWTAYDDYFDDVGPQVSQLMPVISPTGAYAYGNTWTVSDEGHALVAGLPASWSDAAGFSNVLAHPFATVVITGAGGTPLLAYRTEAVGAVVHINHDMTYTTPTINPNALQLLVNAVGADLMPDCNDNGVADAADLAGGAPDSNGNGLPDECEFSGSIPGAQVWESGRTVYVIGDVLITGSLTIEAGVHVVPGDDVAILVQAPGALVINGAANQPVYLKPPGFTGNRWDGLTFNGGTGQITHAILERLTTSGISITGSSPTIDSCTVRDVFPVSGSAYGIKVAGNSLPVISNTLIQNVTGADGNAGGNGANGTNGTNGGNGGGGEACFGGGLNGADGNPGAIAAQGAAGAIGGDAFGVHVSAGAAAHLVGCRIIHLLGGHGGVGGKGGKGGNGGSGGDGIGGFFCGGNGGSGANGQNGRSGGAGGEGGDAIGVRLDQSAGSIVAQNIITHLVGGAGGNGGLGGNSGNGGDGGNGIWNYFASGCGGFGGGSPDAGNGGAGGRGGDVLAVAVYGPAAGTTIAQNTVAVLARGSNGLGGAGGSVGAGGIGGIPGDWFDCGDSCDCANDGWIGISGFTGAAGALGDSVAVLASSVTAGPFTLVQNNIIKPGNASYSVALRAVGNTNIVSDWNCIADFAILASGIVSVGPNTIYADPLLVDPNGADNLPGTEDDDLRLSAGSPCVDAASDEAVPDDVADLDGDGDSGEALPLDADGNDRVAGAAVDIGAYEFGSGPPPACPADLDGDGEVGITDFLDLLKAWGTNPFGPPDLDGDGTVGVTDFLALLQGWGPCS